MSANSSIRDTLESSRRHQLDDRHQELEEEKGNVAAARPAALANLNEQYTILEALEDTRDESEGSLDHLYSREQKLITDFNNIPVSDRTDRVLRDYRTELDLFELHIGLQTVILEDDNNRIEEQELTGIRASQRHRSLANRITQINRQQHVLNIGIAAQQELITATLRVIDSFLSQLVTAGITKLLTEPIPYDENGISGPDQTILQNSSRAYTNLVQKWIIELHSSNMDEQQQRRLKSDLYTDVDTIAPACRLTDTEIQTIKRYLGDFFRASGIGRHGPTSVVLTAEMISILQLLLPS